MPKRQCTIKTFFQRSEEKKRPLLELDDNGSDPVKEDLEGVKDKSLPKHNTLSCSSSSNIDEEVTKIKKAKLGESINSDIDANRTCERIQPTQSITDLKDNILALSQDLNGCLDSNIGLSWFKALEKEFHKPYFKILNDFLIKERQTYTIFPPHDQVWSWTQHFDVKETKVVIIGQDPYHGPMQAHGLCFSVKHGIKPPPSLLNMYKELENDENVCFTRPAHGYLEGWSKQGVLLLNAVLTVRSGQANSHKDRGWEKFTDAVIRMVSDVCEESVVFLLWGSYAQKKAISVNKRHHLLKSVHPSPLSAHRGFIGCKHFSKCNEILVKEGRKPIDWSHLE